MSHAATTLLDAGGVRIHIDLALLPICEWGPAIDLGDPGDG